MMQKRQETEVTKLSQNNLFSFTVYLPESNLSQMVLHFQFITCHLSTCFIIFVLVYHSTTDHSIAQCSHGERQSGCCEIPC